MKKNDKIKTKKNPKTSNQQFLSNFSSSLYSSIHTIYKSQNKLIQIDIRRQIVINCEESAK